jgi:hypothetical protein
MSHFLSSPASRYGAALLVVISLGIMLWIAPDAFRNPNFWAEDGTIFWKQSYDGWRSIIVPYNGYLNLVARLGALAARAFPLAWTPVVFLAVAVLATVGTCLVIAKTIGPIAALAPVLAFGAEEPLANLTNVNWVMACGLLGVLAAGRLSRSAAIFSIFAGLSGPFSLLFSPLIALRLYEAMKECRLASAVYLLLLLEASVQLAFIVFTGRGPVGDQQPAPVHALFELLSRAAGGEERLLLATVMIAVGLAFTRDKKIAIILIYGCIIVALAAVVRFLYAPDVFDRGAGQRYWYVPSAAILLVAASFAAAKERTTLICGIILFVMISVPRNWFDPPRQVRLPDTSWPSAVANAKSGPVEFTFPPGWKVVIPQQ